MIDQSGTSDGRVYVQPTFVHAETTGVIGVWTEKDEEVQWHTYTAPDGKVVVYGWTIKKKTDPTER